MSTEKNLIEEAEDLTSLVEAFDGEENLLSYVKKAVRFAEQQRLSHKKAYLRRQLILQRAKDAGITGEEEA
jgi:hypothetical protein